MKAFIRGLTADNTSQECSSKGQAEAPHVSELCTACPAYNVDYARDLWLKSNIMHVSVGEIGNWPVGIRLRPVGEQLLVDGDIEIDPSRDCHQTK